ncbi:MAG: hypothetical protein NUV67_06375 [archaeon]|nr:hypothetical protein [archaeon]
MSKEQYEQLVKDLEARGLTKGVAKSWAYYNARVKKSMEKSESFFNYMALQNRLPKTQR